MPSGVRHISNIDRSILVCRSWVDGATSIAIKKTAQLSSFIGCSCVRQKVVNCPARDILCSQFDVTHISQAISSALLVNSVGSLNDRMKRRRCGAKSSVGIGGGW
ncbi:hypothetical protein TcCL_Unassigned02923 [Trypanosoma cruzi]|nr:hypothetical protein TcCL_Unassigned02923 [Trypanosoma cruzi]